PSRDPLAIAKNQQLVALVKRLRLAHLRCVDDRRPVHAEKPVAREASLELAQRLADIVGDFGEVDAREIVARLDPEDLVRIEKENLAVDLDPDPVLRRIELAHVLEQRAQLRGHSRRWRILESLPGAIESLVKAHVIDRLEQIIERAELES